MNYELLNKIVDYIESNFGIQEVFKQTISTKGLKGLRKAEDNLC